MAAVADITYTVKHDGGPLPVVIVRDRKSGWDLWSRVTAQIAGFFIAGWLVMLLLPLVGLFPGYWAAVGIYVLSNILFKTNIAPLASLYTREK